jgi:prohibitin 2
MSRKFDVKDLKMLLMVAPPLIGGAALLNCFYNVNPGEAAIKFNYFTGLGNKVYTEGFHLRIPLVEHPVKFNVRTATLPMNVTAQNRDMQECFINAEIFFKPDLNKLDSIYRTLGMNYDQIVMTNIVKEVLKGIVAQYNAQQLITQRDQLSHQVRTAMTIRARQYNILIEGLTISSITFSQNYQRAVDEKQSAQQEAERAKYIVEQSVYQAKTIIQRAQTEAEGFRLIGSQAESSAFLEIQKMNFAVQLSDIFSRSRNRILLNTDMLLVDIFSDVVSSEKIAVEKPKSAKN